MQKSGVVVEACAAGAENYGVVDNLKRLDIGVKGMGRPRTERLKGPWEVLTLAPICGPVTTAGSQGNERAAIRTIRTARGEGRASETWMKSVRR